MNYEMEELLPVVAELANEYTGSESTSITYEKAEQLMEAVQYCVDHMEKTGGDVPESRIKLPARQAYEIGYNCVVEKVKKPWAFIMRFCRNLILMEIGACMTLL